MVKLVPVITAAAGTAVLSCGGWYLLRDRDVRDIGSRTLEEFIDNRGGYPTQHFFGHRVSFDKTSQLAQDNIPTHYSADDAESQLVVNWERTDSSAEGDDRKWSGSFRWLWHVRSGNHGLTMFMAAAPSSTDAKYLDLYWGIFSISRDSSSPHTWRAYYGKTVSDKAVTPSGDTVLDKTLPKTGDGLKATLGADDISEGRKDHWGFLSGAEDLKGLCRVATVANCPTPNDKPKVFRAAWSWKASESAADQNKKKVTSWASNWSDLMKTMLDDSKLNDKNNKLKEYLEKFEGSWSRIP